MIIFPSCGLLTKEGFDCSTISFPAFSYFPCLNFNPVPAFYLQPSMFLSQLPLFSQSLSIYLSQVSSNMSFWHAMHNSFQFSSTWPFPFLSLIHGPAVFLLIFVYPGCLFSICCSFDPDKHRWCYPRKRVLTSCTLVLLASDTAKWRNLRETVRNQAAVKARLDACDRRRSAEEKKKEWVHCNNHHLESFSLLLNP